ncbi:uncharacterized protein DUF4440 [Novosphingobium sp. PhB165]|uniref:DUF4440 domain-containing protein n=1 Tax=Novosphingobium sp. PhB165 TaxID=2485105 RepID=UPI001048AA95|nr:DUF4440 domain-containing protein [Novosphingobium sp. PhB165]TCM19489.1 uncharacterized protein DUF4440 [Novosphingobium sp. PhB165]
MKRRHSARLMLSAALACALLPGLAHADTKSDLEARYAALKTAMDTREPDDIKPFLTPDFKRTDLGGNSMNADDMIERLANIPVDPSRKSTNTITSVTVNGQTAEVEQRQDASDNRQGRDGETHQIAMSELSHDTWVQTDKGWLLKSTETEQMTISRDGQVVRTMKKGDPMPPRGGRGGPGGGRMGPPPSDGNN